MNFKRLNNNIMLLPKYLFAIGAIVFSSSAYLYNTTGCSENFWYIFCSIGLGSLLGTFFYLISIHWGSKVFSKIINK